MRITTSDECGVTGEVIVGEAQVLGAQSSGRVPIVRAPPDAKALGKMHKPELIEEIHRLRVSRENALIQEQRAGVDCRAALTRACELDAKLSAAEKRASEAAAAEKGMRQYAEELAKERDRRLEEVDKLSNKLDFALYQMSAAKAALKNLLTVNLDEGRSWTSVRDVLNLLLSQLVATKLALEKW